MIGRLTRYGLPWSNVGANLTASQNITPGRTLEGIRLKLGGGAFTKAHLSLVRFRANGKILIEGTGAQLESICAYQGITTEAGYLDLPLIERGGATEFDRMAPAWDTEVFTNMEGEVAVGAATTPTLLTILSESAVQKDPKGTPLPWRDILKKILRYPFNVAAGGQLSFLTPFGRDNAGMILRLHVFNSYMTGALVKLDGLAVHESLAAENANEQKSWGKVPQAGMYSLDFALDGNIRKALDTRNARSLEWLFTFSQADAGFVVVEYLNRLGDL